MFRFAALTSLGLALAIVSASTAAATTVPFVEEFNTNASNWWNASKAAPDYFATGGPDGSGYISSNHTLSSNPQAQVIFRGQAENDASGDNFVGSWIAGGVIDFSFWIRQNSSVAMTVGTRFATPLNSPAWSITTGNTLVQPNTWTEIHFSIDALNPAFTPEGPVAFATVFGNLGNLQILAEKETLATGTVVRFDIDRVAVVPEPASLAMAGIGAVGLAAIGLRRRAAKKQR